MSQTLLLSSFKLMLSIQLPELMPVSFQSLLKNFLSNRPINHISDFLLLPNTSPIIIQKNLTRNC